MKMRERHEGGAAALRKKLFSTGALLAALVCCCPLLAYAYFGMEVSGALAEVTAGTYLPELTISGVGDAPVKLEGTALNTSITVSVMPEDGSAKEIQMSLRNSATGDAIPFRYELEVVPVLAAGQTAGPVAAFAEGTATQEGRPLCVAGEVGAGDGEQSVYSLRLTQAATLNINLRTAFVNQTIDTAADFAGLRPQEEGAPFAPGTVIYLTQDIDALDEVLAYNESTGYPTLDLNGHKLMLKGLETRTENADTYALMEIRNGTLVVGEESYEFSGAQEAPVPYAAENGGTVHLTLLKLGAAYYVAPAQPLVPAAPPEEAPDDAVPPAESGADSELQPPAGDETPLADKPSSGAGNDGMGNDVDSAASDAVSSAPPVSESESGADVGGQANSESQPDAADEIPSSGESGMNPGMDAKSAAVQEVPAGTLQTNGETMHVIE